MSKRSAGILPYRKVNREIEVLLIHPGGPFWQNKDENAWSIPKGLVEEGEDEFLAAIREFKEETGFEILNDEFIELKEVKLSNGKIIKIWATENDYDTVVMKSNLFRMEWPLKSGKFQEFPEADKADWFSIETAKSKIVNSQIDILVDLERLL